MRTQEQAIAIQESDRAVALVAELPPQQRQVIDLAFFAGYTQQEIAARVGIPPGRQRSGAPRLLRLRHAAECEAVPTPTA